MQDQDNDYVDNKDNEDRAFVAFARNSKAPTELAPTVSERDLINSYETEHMMEDVSAITGKAIPSEIIIGTPGEDMIKALAHGESVIIVW